MRQWEELIEQRQRHETEQVEGQSQLHRRAASLAEREQACARQEGEAGAAVAAAVAADRGAPPAATVAARQLQEREQRVQLAELQLVEQRDGLLDMQRQVRCGCTSPTVIVVRNPQPPSVLCLRDISKKCCGKCPRRPSLIILWYNSLRRTSTICRRLK